MIQFDRIFCDLFRLKNYIIHEKDFDTIVTYLMSDIGSSWNSVSSVVEFKFVSSAFAFVCFERAIFQTFWRLHCVTKSLFFEIETSNFGSSFVFSSPLNLQGQILPNLTF